MECVGVVCKLMRLLSVTDKCKKRKCQGWAELQKGFFAFIWNQQCLSTVSSGHYSTQSQGYCNCLKLCEYNIRHCTASVFVCSHPVHYQRPSHPTLFETVIGIPSSFWQVEVSVYHEIAVFCCCLPSMSKSWWCVTGLIWQYEYMMSFPWVWATK